MRFLQTGPDVPDELLVARDEGRVVFFCGAGVSRAKAGLKDFLGLAISVADKLSIAADRPARQLIKAIETIPSIPGVGNLIAADRVFGLFEKDFLSSDIYRAIADALKPDDTPDLSAHQLLLDLARGPDGTVKLVTTNFDLLFENCDPSIPSLRPPRLPDPLRSNEFNGIIHLHGQVTSDYSDAAGDGFVISSSEFGRAYLSERWAADFIRSVLERFYVVFVGYSADDPPMQYLLEALNRSPGSLSGAYALQSGSYEDAKAKWVQKGVKPIIYEEAQSHSALWDTLSAWAERARNPDAWFDGLLAKASVGPEQCEPHVRGQVAHAVSTLVGAKRIADAVNPIPALWLCTFDPLIRFGKPGRAGSFMEEGEYFDPFTAYGLDSDPVPAKIDSDNDLFAKREAPLGAWNAFALSRQDRQDLQEDQVSALRGHWSVNSPRLTGRIFHLGRWLQKVALQPSAAWWAAYQKGIHPDVQRQIEFSIAQKDQAASATIKQAWRYLIESWANPNDGNRSDYHQLVDTIEADGWNPAIARDYISAHRPRVEVGHAWQGASRAPKEMDVSLRDLINLDVEYLSHFENVKIPTEYLQAIVKGFRENLELGESLEDEQGAYALSRLSPLEPNDNASDQPHRSGINILLFEYARLVRMLTGSDRRAARREMAAWDASTGVVATHIRIWSMGNASLVRPKELGRALNLLDRDDFWRDVHRRDLLVALHRRWGDFPKSAKDKLERRLLKGPKRFRAETPKAFKRRRARMILNRVHWLASKGCDLSFDLQAITEDLKIDAPEWHIESANKAAESGLIYARWVGTDTRSDELFDVPLSQVFETAERLASAPQEALAERDPYAGLSVDRPARAFAALTVAGKAGHYPIRSWRTFLNRGTRKGDSVRFVVVIALRISCVPDEFLKDLIRPVADWLLQVQASLLPKRRDVFDKLWKRLVDLLASDDDVGSSSIMRHNQKEDWATEALNSATGDLAQILMSDPAIKPTKVNRKYPKWWKERADELLALSGDRGRYALVIMCHNLAWLFANDQRWVSQALLPAIEEGSASNDAFWAGFFWGARVPAPQLYMLIKPSLLRLVNRKTHTREHAEVLAGILLAGWGTKLEGSETRLVTDAEMTTLLVDADDDFRTQLLWHLENWSKEEGSSWKGDALVLLEKVWPKQIAAKTPRVSAKLSELAFAQTERFPDYVDRVLPLVVPIDQDHIRLPSIRRTAKNFVDQYPEKVLALLSAILPDGARLWPYGISDLLDRIVVADIKLRTDARLVRLLQIRAAF